jgi:hypothetical protein
MPVAVMDELAFYRLEGAADSDSEIQTSIRRGRIGFPSPKLLKISTPYLKGGVLFEDFKRAFGQDDPDLLVWRASTVLMNPTISAAKIARERRLDPDRAAREYEAEFFDDRAAFLARELIDLAVVRDRRELPPAKVRHFAAVDPSGGGADAFTLAIAHVEGDRIVQDVARGWSKPRGGQVNLEGIVRQIADVLRAYGLQTCTGDNYSKLWVQQRFQDVGIRYMVSRATRSDAYLALEPLLLQGSVELLDHPEMIRQLGLLEKRYKPGGRVSVDHPTGAHDDYANAVALAITGAAQSRRRPKTAQEEEAMRPDPDGDRAREAALADQDELEANIARLLALAPPTFDVDAWLVWLEREVRADLHGGYVADKCDELNWNTAEARLRRAGLR